MPRDVNSLEVDSGALVGREAVSFGFGIDGSDDISGLLVNNDDEAKFRATSGTAFDDEATVACRFLFSGRDSEGDVIFSRAIWLALLDGGGTSS
jgi:hypothetical protein